MKDKDKDKDNDKNIETEDSFNEGLMEFIEASPTPYHAVAKMISILSQKGFSELKEEDNWSLKEGNGYYVIRNDSSIVAFQMGKKDKLEHGIRLVGAHTDSPCLKVKPNPEFNTCGYGQLGVEIYGGVILSSWFDRDLSLAGKISWINSKGKLLKSLIKLDRPIAVLPNLAIHLNRNVNEGIAINKQKEMTPLLMQLDSPEFSPAILSTLFEEYFEDENYFKGGKVLGIDLSFYDVQKPSMVGLKKDFLTSARIDNLLSCYVGLRSLLEGDKNLTNVLVCNDHEEVGSASFVGAQGPFLKSVLKRICSEQEIPLDRILGKSVMVSTDNAHGIHPNYLEKHDLLHAPLLNNGPALKVNHNQRYGTNSETGGLFQYLCVKANVPLQVFVARSDMGCGSTIGPITSTVLGIKVVDVGVPTFAMHSIRETAGSKDSFFLFKALREFFRQKDTVFNFSSPS